MLSKRTKTFKKLFDRLPDEVKENARKQYKLFCEDPSHPSLRAKPIGSTRNNKIKAYEVTVGIGFGAPVFRMKTYVWFWIGTHNSFDKKY